MKVSLVACGDQHTCFLTLQSEVYTVGSNCFGQLGHGTLSSCTIPNKVFLNKIIITNISNFKVYF